MIDFNNASFIKLKRNDSNDFNNLIQPILQTDEKIVSSYKGIRDGVVFTSKRILAINVQGITGTKKDITSIPYSKIQTFSTETAGTFDLDSELEVWISGVGKVKFEFHSNCNILEICKIIGEYVL